MAFAKKGWGTFFRRRLFYEYILAKPVSRQSNPISILLSLQGCSGSSVRMLDG